MRIDELKFAKPVLPNTTIYVDAEVISKKKSTNGERGYIGIRLETKNKANDEVVASQIWTALMPYRP